MCRRGAKWFSGSCGSEGISREAQIFDDSTADQMFLDDPLGVFRRDVLIPRSLGIHDRNRPRGADAHALAARAIAGPIGPSDVELLHPLFQIFPRCFTDFRRDAIGPDADEEMPSE